jgi:hypothetical protein
MDERSKGISVKDKICRAFTVHGRMSAAKNAAV